MSNATVIFDFCNYIEKVCPLLLGGDAVPPPKTANFKEEINNFVNESNISTIYIALRKDKSDDGLDTFQYEISTTALSGSSNTASMAFLKRKAAPLSPTSTLQQQLRVIELGGSLVTVDEENIESDDNNNSKAATDDAEDEDKDSSRTSTSENDSFEVLYGYLHHMFAPLLQSYVLKLQQNRDNDGSNGGDSKDLTSEGLKQSLPLLGKRIQELEYALKTCMQQTEIPDVVFNIEPEVITYVSREESEGHLSMEELGIDSLPEDSALLKRLKKGVNRWYEDTKQLSTLSRDISSGAAIEEVSFWTNMERSLQNVDSQMKDKGVEITLRILKHYKQFGIILAFQQDTGLTQKITRVSSYMAFIRDFPVNSLVTSSTVKQMEQAVLALFSHMRKMKTAQYPLKRAFQLLEAVSRDLSKKLVTLLKPVKMMELPYEIFARENDYCISLFKTWDQHCSGFRELARDIAKKRGVEKSTPRLVVAHSKLRDRLEDVYQCRQNHEKLRHVIQDVLKPLDKSNNNSNNKVDLHSPNGSSAINEINEAYKHLRNADIYDVSTEGIAAWEAAKKQYELRIDAIETNITATLTTLLASAQTGDEKFRVFSKFNALFFRQRIRGAIQQHQTDLIQTVKEDINALQQKFKRHYSASESERMSGLRDLPPMSAKIIWAKQIERQLDQYMDRIEAVLGSGWETHADGRALKNSCDSFKKKLDTQPIFNEWIERIKDSSNFEVGGRIFDVRKRSAGSSNTILQLGVSFNKEIITLFKEVRNLAWLANDHYGFRVPYTIKIMSDEAKERYPYAMALTETLRTYQHINTQLSEDIGTLTAKTKKSVQVALAKAFNKHIKWDSESLEQYVKDLSKKVYSLQDQVSDLVSKVEAIEKEVDKLKLCEYTYTAFEDKLNKIQEIVDEMNLAEYSNLGSWTKSLDKKVESILLYRMSNAIAIWVKIHTLKNKKIENMNTSPTKDKGERKYSIGSAIENEEGVEAKNVEEDTKAVSALSQPIVLGIILRNRILQVNPPLARARSELIEQFQSIVNVISRQKRIKSSVYDDAFRTNNDARNRGLNRREQANKQMYFNLCSMVEQDLIYQVYGTIESCIKAAGEYCVMWLQYQALWDVVPENIVENVGESIDKWVQMLEEIRSSRETFESSEYEKHFGVVVVNYKSVQTKVGDKYDVWHRDMLSRFGNILQERMNGFYNEASKARNQLEKMTLDADINEIVAFVTTVRNGEANKDTWKLDLKSFQSSQRLLVGQRFRFPEDWLYIDNLEGEWDAFNQILSKKIEVMDERIPELQRRIMQEDRRLENDIKELETSWKKERNENVIVAQEPSIALNTLALFDTQVQRLKDRYNSLRKAIDALGLDTAADARLDPILAEVKGFKEVWSALGDVWNRVDTVKDTLWGAFLPRKYRASLDGILEAMDAMPSRIQQYEAFQNLYNKVKDYKKNLLLLTELKSDAIKERHWREIKKTLKITFSSLNNLSVGTILDADLKRCDRQLKDVIRKAQGEMALEEFVKELKEFWSTYKLNLVNYLSKCRLIKDWDELFSKLDDNLSALGSMKQSPYYKVFQDDAKFWEDKLETIRLLFDIWIDVQRRWVYLEGIFLGSADIKLQLPNEYSRFRSINNEFVKLMQQVSKKSEILEVVAISNLEDQLTHLSKLLNNIQKALGEYLERQRTAFPRFYFCGDEDLLEIIGNGKEPVKILKHIGKMFAGITSLELDGAEKRNVIAFASKEGEVVTLKEPYSIGPAVPVNDYLTEVERSMRSSLALLLDNASQNQTNENMELNMKKYIEFVHDLPAQIVILSSQVTWSTQVEKNIQKLDSVAERINLLLNGLADKVIERVSADRRKKYEQLMTEFVHQRDATRQLILLNTENSEDFHWLAQLRYYYFANEANILERLNVRCANATFYYGFEYLGVGERLVQTPLTDRCYLTLTQALSFRLGGNPFGPAGTGKTESVKALGAQLGRFVLVFNCDESFDFQAMGRIFVGLCQVGAWGCFDEFNRLEERMLSAVSQQILAIQTGLQKQAKEIQLLGRNVGLHSDVGIFVTMNPGYAGRSNLPDNLKLLFRGCAMMKPDFTLIAEVIMFSQGFKQAEIIAGKVVLLFRLCLEQFSKQPHYDFGLRALKSVLVNAGSLKREMRDRNETREELHVIIQSVVETIMPKLVAEDIVIFKSLIAGVFPGASTDALENMKIKDTIKTLCEKYGYVYSSEWVSKALQVYQVQCMRHGVMLVGPTGSGKTSAWQIILEAMTIEDGIKGESYVIDAKALQSKEVLYGSLDQTTYEWSDGVFTSILRAILNNVRGESNKRHWIVFDGDVDPEWAENLNSVLDDNKLLTLPNGERLAIPNNVRIMFETETLKYATLATVSRCGMVWFSDGVVTTSMIFQKKLKNFSCDYLSQYFEPDGAVEHLVEQAVKMNHVMTATRVRLLHSMFSLFAHGEAMVTEYNNAHVDFPMETSHEQTFITNWLLFSLVWGLSGSMNQDLRLEFCSFIGNIWQHELPVDATNSEYTLIDYEVNIDDGGWRLWKVSVPTVDIESHRVMATDLIIPTVDTVRHLKVLEAWLGLHCPVILCGPPGSGKSMTLTSVLNSMPNFMLAPLNFSSGTTPELILKTFQQYCEYRSGRDGMTLSPSAPGKWLIIFCDEINLPENDSYGTQRVITFLRQLTEKKGFWKEETNEWVTIQRIQFVGACNPPTDPGRVVMSNRWLRHAPILFVDFPSPTSLNQIYGTFSRGLLKLQPSLRSYSDSLTDAMVEMYVENRTRFKPTAQPHYIYSPRELSRWVRALYKAMKEMADMKLEDLVRVWLHEGLRLFLDRLTTAEEQMWCSETADKIALKNFVGADPDCIKRPILFSNWLSKQYQEVEPQALRQHVEARLRTFYEEELDVELVVFDEVLDHVLRIDRVLRQPLGHLLLVGDSGAGKTVLSKFCAWMNGLSIFQIKLTKDYSIDDFDVDLREVMKRAGILEEKICFIFDESNVLSSAFLEHMNALLASGEVPGLFEDDELSSLLQEMRSRSRTLVDSEDELFRLFTKNVQMNLHIVFTMNPAGGDFKNRSSTSPALFNRCVVDWFGTWSTEALKHVGRELTRFVDVGEKADDVIESIVTFHQAVGDFRSYTSPRDFLDFIDHFVSIYQEKRSQLEDQQRHLAIGLGKLNETAETVKELEIGLAEKEKELKDKNEQANATLQQMVKDQNEAETRKVEAVKLKEDLDERNKVVDARREEAEADLANAEPALLAAQEAVKSIKKKHLDEMRALGNPPKNVKLTLEAVAIMIKGITDAKKIPDWRALRTLLRGSSFISDVVGFDPHALVPETRQLVQSKYLNVEDFNLETISRANRACGPLYQWLNSQVNFASIAERVAPLREEVEKLALESKSLSERHEKLTSEITELESSISTYKSEYAQLIKESEAIKGEMESVKSKCDRAATLLRSLSEEQIRWEDGRETFQLQMSSIVGDVLLASAFCVYSGYFDFRHRANLMLLWEDQLAERGITVKENLEIVEYLSSGSERIGWKANGLPDDTLCIENGIILSRFKRFPLIIDPSGQATEYLLRENEKKKIKTTSFLDASFMKHLESSLRFGTILLVQDVENIDPILNPVLNREFQKTGGRVLIRLGDQEIDFSPSFSMYLTTRDPFFKFTPDVCSRVTFVNFTVTPSSLERQCLGRVLKAKRPDIDKQRSDLLKLQGEYQARLRELEGILLQKIASVEGTILDDDKVISALENLKREAREVNAKAANANEVMKTVVETSSRFQSVANVCSTVYFSVASLRKVHYLYQFSLSFFFQGLDAVLSDEGSNETNLSLEIVKKIYYMVSRGMLRDDKLLLAMRLAQILAELGENQLDELFAVTQSQKDVDISAAELGPFETLVWSKSNKADSVIQYAETWVSSILGKNVIREAEFHLKDVIEEESLPHVPILLCSLPGYDASGQVVNIADKGKSLKSLSMGSDSGFAMAEKYVMTAAQKGSWVLLRNIHLCPKFIVRLEKQLHSLRPAPTFRLFLTAEVNPNIPQSLILLSQTFVFEPPAGIKASLTRSLMAVPESRMNQAPAERGRVYFLLMWFHALVLERLQYVPIGWSKSYEFSSSDQNCSLRSIDEWIERVANGRMHVAPEEIPWDALRAILGQSFYGGRVDNKFDQALLDSFLNDLFSPKSFNKNFSLCEGIIAPEGTKHKDFMTWVEELPNNNSPTWMGLSASAENVILEHKGKSVLKKLFMIQDAAAIVGTSAGKEDGDDNEGQNSASDKNKTLNSTIFQNALMKSRQAMAKSKSISLDSLTLTVDFERKSTDGTTDVEFCVQGLYLEGAEVEGNILKLSDQGKWNLSITTFSWREKEASDVDAADNSASIKKNELLIPFYFDAGRHELIASVPVKYDISGSVTAQQYLQRGVAMVVGDDCKL